MKCKLSELRAIINRQLDEGRRVSPRSVINELSTKTIGGEDSLDSQVDQYLSKYLKAAAEANEDSSSDDDEGGTKINVEEFVNDVANLIENYDSLLEFKSSLVRRALNFLSKNHDGQVVREAETAFRSMHSLVPGKSKDERDAEDFGAPRAAEAGPL